MRALCDQNQGINRAAGATSRCHWERGGLRTSPGLAVRPDDCKRLLAPRADSGVGSGIWLGRYSVAYATWEYSRIRPPGASSPASGQQQARQAT